MALFWTLVLSAAVLGTAMTIVAYLTWIERKVAARFHNRVGPYYVGWPHGWLQPLADVAKLIIKEDLRPRRADALLYELAPVLVVVPALFGFALLPLGPGLAVLDHPYSLLLFLAVSSLALLGIFAAGWGSHNAYALLSSLRSVAVAVSYEIPLILALLAPAILFGTFRLDGMVQHQAAALPFFFAPVVGQLSFLIFLISMLAEANKSPLDVVEAESELIAGYGTEYSGMKFALFYAGEYAHTLALCGLGATVFFGGYLGPAFLPGALWLVLKSLALFVLVLWIRWSFLRVRIDQVLRLNWRFLFPLALANLLLAAFLAVRS
ncbi:MAG TPA: NADH-quinone oxidoreductase subunit NuoH [Candidatus Polarisedimenticolaceae bacterium]|nr:NADH-quinone oxidoreductase subunit NuoH [Candidatus Polarisedimenticolaceae bacterium]